MLIFLIPLSFAPTTFMHSYISI